MTIGEISPLRSLGIYDHAGSDQEHPQIYCDRACGRSGCGLAFVASLRQLFRLARCGALGRIITILCAALVAFQVPNLVAQSDKRGPAEVVEQLVHVQTKDDIADSGALFAPPKDVASVTETSHLVNPHSQLGVPTGGSAALVLSMTRRSCFPKIIPAIVKYTPMMK